MQTKRNQKRRILLVDDEVGFTRLMKMNLEKDGSYQVMVENRSTKAHLAAKLFHPDVILLDVVMPEIDGGDVLAALRADAQLASVPVIMVTALVWHGETNYGAIAVSGKTPVLAKPVDMQILFRCINEALSGEHECVRKDERKFRLSESGSSLKA